MRLVESMNTNNSRIQTQMELVSQRVSFQDAITCLSTYIATIFPLRNQKRRKALISETGTGSTKDFRTHCNSVKCTKKNWKDRFSNEDYNLSPIQVRKLIEFAKQNGFKERNEKRNEDGGGDNKRHASEMSHPKWFDNVDDDKSRKIAQVVAHALRDNTQDESGDNPETIKNRVNKGAGTNFGNKGN